jgi:hypothetical protein
MSFTGSSPQFNTAEYSSGGENCKSCKQPIAGTYYRINGMLACERCAGQVQQQSPKDTHNAFARAITFGIVAAILGCALYAGFVIVSGISIGFVSLAVGWLIGKGMKMGSSGIGGRRYQIAAAALTYIAVSMAEVPIVLHYSGKSLPAMNAAVAGRIALFGLESPFRDLSNPFNGLIGLVILFVGMQIAWKLTAGPKLDIQGPFYDKVPGALPTSAT